MNMRMEWQRIFDAYREEVLDAGGEQELLRLLREDAEASREFVRYMEDTVLTVQVARELELQASLAPDHQEKPVRIQRKRSSNPARPIRQASPRPATPVRSKFRSRWMFAAAAVVLIVVGLELHSFAPRKVEFADGTRVWSGWGSRWQMLPEGGELGVELLRGSLEADVAPQSEGTHFVLRTPDVRTEVWGTRLGLQTAEGHTQLRLDEGKVFFQREQDGVSRMVVAGETADTRDALLDPNLNEIEMNWSRMEHYRERNLQSGFATEKAAMTVQVGERDWVFTGQNQEGSWLSALVRSEADTPLPDQVVLRTTVRPQQGSGSTYVALRLMEKVMGENVDLKHDAQVCMILDPLRGSVRVGKDNLSETWESRRAKPGEDLFALEVKVEGSRIRMRVNGDTVYEGPHGLQHPPRAVVVDAGVKNGAAETYEVWVSPLQVGK